MRQHSDLDPQLLGFRRLERGDLPLMHRWLNTPHVLEWWDQPGPSYEQVVAKYDPRILEAERTQCYVVTYGELPIGYIQAYLIEDYPVYAEALGIDEHAAGVDLFIGDPHYVHRGLGPSLLRRFVERILFVRPDVESCIIGPSDRNRSAIRAYEKAGFEYLKTATVPDEDDPEYLMRLGREAFSEQSRPAR